MGTWNFVEEEGILLAQLELSLDSTQDITIINWFEVKGLTAGLQERASPFPAIFQGCISEYILTLLTLVGKKKRKDRGKKRRIGFCW